MLQAATVVSSAATAFGGAAGATARADAAGAADAFTRLPPAASPPAAGSAGQLGLQLAGLCGRYEERSHFLAMDTSGWAHRTRRLGGTPYWLRSYAARRRHPGPAALATSKRWIDAILATQESGGFFGPRALRTS
ncbi:hypothetical protein [Streptomyces sp. KL116D]|uniref:hypothetical protein n=1 Tax=Streptomyces sp. KL116D TaxID=3045152 RepID=UPI003558952D